MKTKNNKIYFSVILITVFILGFSLSELTGEKFPIGSTRLHDSTSTILTINKSVFIGSELKTGQVRFREYNSIITEGLSEMQLSSPAFSFQTLNENVIAFIDSTNGLNVVEGYLSSNFVKTGASSPTYEIKEIKGKLGSSTNAGYTFAHGVTDIKKIHDWSCIVMDDSGAYSYKPQSWFTPYVFYAKLNATTCQVTIPTNHYGTLNDSVFFTLRINR